MAQQGSASDKEFDVPKKEAIRLLGVSERTLQRWVNEGLIERDYKPGPYGEEAYYNRDDLLKMRDGKPRKDASEGPMKQADLALIAQESKWTHEQLSQTLTTLSEELPSFRRELKEAKDETIGAVKEQGNLQKQIGKLEQVESQLKSEQKELHNKVGELESKYKEASRYKQLFQSAILWGGVAVLLVLFLSVVFAPQLQGVRDFILSALK